MNRIPEMTDPMGRHWQQPDRSRIQAKDDMNVYVSREDFDRILVYNSSYPTGVYPGKMWRRLIEDRQVDLALELGKEHRQHVWALFWYGDDDQGRCSINWAYLHLEGE